MNNTQDIRFQQLQQWLQSFITDKAYSLTTASSDASFRRYFRLKQQHGSFIIMDSPPEHEDNQSFINVATLLEQYGLNVPHIYQQDLQSGFLILSDLGSTPYLSQLSTTTADELYKNAINSLIKLQKIPCKNQSLPHYDSTLLQREMWLFDEWFLQKHLQLTAPDWLKAIYDLLINNALSQPQVLVHRDFHSRNLMFLPGQAPGVIDFQDAVIGAISYDLVSLLRDVYIQWSPAEQQRWVGYYIEQAQQHGLLTSEQAEKFPRWFDLMGLQRHLKILGIFCRLNYRDNKPNYMNDLALTLNYVYQVCEIYPELENLYQYLIEQPKNCGYKMKAMILAAGRGERLRPLTDHTPKPLLHAGPKRLIEYLIEKLVDAGLKDIVINHAHLGEQFEPILGGGERYHANFEYSAEVTGGLETAGGIIQALPLLGNEPFLVVNGDIWTDFPFADLTKLTLTKEQLCHLVMVNNPAHNPAGDFHLDADGLLSLEGEPKLTFSGIGVYRSEMFAEHSVAKLALKPFFVEAMKQRQATGQHYQGQWSDIGTVERLTELATQLDI